MSEYEHELEDTTDGRSYRFDGAQLAHVSSQSEDKSMWTEYTVWRTDGGQYVIARDGVPASDSRREFARKVLVARSAAEIELVVSSTSVRSPDGRWHNTAPYLGNLQKDLLEELAEVDEDVAEAYWNTVIS